MIYLLILKKGKKKGGDKFLPPSLKIKHYEKKDYKPYLNYTHIIIISQ